MAAKILLAVDGSESSLRAVEHVGEVLAGSRGSEVTLCHVVRIPPRLLEHGGASLSDGGLTPQETLEAQERWEADVRVRVEERVFGPAKRILKEKGVDADTAQIRANVAEDAHPDVALHLMRKAERNGFSAVVLGRRGRSALREFALGSVSSKVIHHIQNCAVWIVD